MIHANHESMKVNFVAWIERLADIQNQEYLRLYWMDWVSGIHSHKGTESTSCIQ